MYVYTTQEREKQVREKHERDRRKLTDHFNEVKITWGSIAPDF